MKDDVIQYRHAKLLRDAQIAGITIEDIARALAAAEGQLAAFDDGPDRGNLGVGHYAHGIIRAEALIERATGYKPERAG